MFARFRARRESGEQDSQDVGGVSGAWRGVWRTHLGLVRELNEDRVIGRDDLRLWGVADGMGGHRHGDVAAQAVVDALAALLPGTDEGANINAVRDALNRVNGTLCVQSPGETMGATVVVLIFSGDRYACLWAGDSRAYLMRDGILQRLTRDHSVTQEMIDRGLLTESQGKAHPQSSVITSAVGAFTALRLDVIEGKLERGDRFLLCTDGLTAVLQDEAIVQAFREPHDEPVAIRLIEEVLAGGAPDNVSLVLVSRSQD